MNHNRQSGDNPMSEELHCLSMRVRKNENMGAVVHVTDQVINTLLIYLLV